MNITVIVPAFNEEAYLATTLDSINAAAACLRSNCSASTEIIVVDNNSTDATANLAASKGAKVVHEQEQGIARARNAGARHERGDVLVFIDADVAVPPTLLEAIHDSISNPACVGGGVDVKYSPQSRMIRLYLWAWRLLGRATGMVQGATQFCRKDSFLQIGGYDETAWIGEDVDFYWALRRLARSTGGSVALIREPRVYPSTRRFDRWPLWKTLVWTNPLFIALLRRRKRAWAGWYSRPVR